MIRKIFSLAVFIGMTVSVNAQFNKALGSTTGSWQLTGGKMIQLDNGEFITIGTDYNYGSGDFAVVKMNSAGTVMWKRHYGLASSTESALCITELTDHTVVIGGWTSSDGGGAEFSSYFIRIAPSNGYLYWSRVMQHPTGTSGSNVAQGICSTSDNCFVVTGYWADVIDSPSLYAFKMTNAGLLYWKYEYNFSQVEIGTITSEGTDISENADGTLILTGFTTNDGTLLLKLNAVTGAVLWANRYTTLPGSEWGNSVSQTSDGGYIATGRSDNKNHTFKTDATGVLMWSRIFSTDALEGNDVIQTSDGGYAVADDNGLLKLNSTGGLTWAKKYHGGLFNTIQLSTGEYMLSGRTVEFGFALGAFLFVKTDALGECCGTLPAIVTSVAHSTTTYSLAVTTASPMTITSSSPLGNTSIQTEVSMCNCTVDAGPDKTNENRACCTPGVCTSVVLGSAATSGYSYSWSGGPFSCTSGTCNQVNANPCATTTYKVTASASGCLTSYDYAVVTPIYIDCCGPRRMAGPDGDASDAVVNIYPNPAHDHLTIELNENVSDGQQVMIEVTDMQGKRMFYEEYISDTRSYQIDFSGFDIGMYIVNVTAGDRTTIQKITVE